MAALPYIQLYVADYLADTQHLTLEEHGAYLLLIMNYWQRGQPLVDSDKRLSSVCSTDVQRWLEIRSTVQEFFEVKDGLWIHHRIERDLEKVRRKSVQASEAGKISAAKRAAITDNSNGRSTDVQRTHQRESNHTDTDIDTEQIKKKRKKTYVEPDGPTSPCFVIFEHWKATLNHPKARLDQKREKLIKARLKDGYTVEALCDAITGCQLSPWHQGENKDNRVYDDLCLILRDGAHVDQFIRVKENPPNRNLSAQGRQAVDDTFRWLEMHREREQREAGANEG